MERELKLDPEWRLKPGEELGRADLSLGADVSQHDLGLGSEFWGQRGLSLDWRERLHRLKLWHRRARAVNYGEKSLRETLIDLDKLCEDLNLPKGIKAQASVLIRKAKALKLLGGRSTWGALGALLFTICRERGVPRTELEVSRALALRAGFDELKALRVLRSLTKLLCKRLGLRLPKAKPADYIQRFGLKLGLSPRAVARAQELCSLGCEPLKLKPGYLVAAAALYVGGKEVGERVTLRRVAEVLGVGVSSLSQLSKLLRGLMERR